jgi:hypothetical protein
MHMVAHEDVGVHADMVLGHRLAQKVVEVPAIEVVDEDGAAIDAALGDVKRSTCKLEARATWLARKRAGGPLPAQPAERDNCARAPPEGASVNSLRPF